MSWKCEGCGTEMPQWQFCGNCGAKKPAKKRRLAEEIKRLNKDRYEHPTKDYSDFMAEGLVEFIGKVYKEWISSKTFSFEDYIREELL